jgi:hypothetical protein
MTFRGNFTCYDSAQSSVLELNCRKIIFFLEDGLAPGSIGSVNFISSTTAMQARFLCSAGLLMVMTSSHFKLGTFSRFSLMPNIV